MANNSPWHHLYNTKRWYQLRWHQLQAEPLCRRCAAQGRTVEARIADHVVAHRGDETLFFDAANLQSLCKQCHDSAKQREEKTGVVVGCDVNGLPIDPNHHWNRQRRGR